MPRGLRPMSMGGGYSLEQLKKLGCFVAQLGDRTKFTMDDNMSLLFIKSLWTYITKGLTI